MTAKPVSESSLRCPCGHPAQRHYVDTPYGKASRTVCYDCPPGRCDAVSAGGAR